MEEIRGKRTCKICEETGEITVSCCIKKDGEKIPMLTAPCPKCRDRNKE